MSKARIFAVAGLMLLTSGSMLPAQVRYRSPTYPTKSPIATTAREGSQAEPARLVPNSREPLNLFATNLSLSDVCWMLSTTTGIAITFDPSIDSSTRMTTILKGVSLEEALDAILSTVSLAYDVVNSRSILIHRQESVRR